VWPRAFFNLDSRWRRVNTILTGVHIWGDFLYYTRKEPLQCGTAISEQTDLTVTPWACNWYIPASNPECGGRCHTLPVNTRKLCVLNLQPPSQFVPARSTLQPPPMPLPSLHSCDRTVGIGSRQSAGCIPVLRAKVGHAIRQGGHDFINRISCVLVVEIVLLQGMRSVCALKRILLSCLYF
jgi:hypothetical protein